MQDINLGPLPKQSSIRATYKKTPVQMFKRFLKVAHWIFGGLIGDGVTHEDVVTHGDVLTYCKM